MRNIARKPHEGTILRMCNFHVCGAMLIQQKLGGYSDDFDMFEERRRAGSCAREQNYNRRG